MSQIRRHLAVRRMAKCKTSPRWRWTPLGKPRIRAHGPGSRLEKRAELWAMAAGGRTFSQAERMLAAIKAQISTPANEARKG